MCTTIISLARACHAAITVLLPLQAFTDIKNYYNDITHNNLDLMKTLQEDVTERKKKDSQNEKLMFEIAQENKRLSEPLQKVSHAES